MRAFPLTVAARKDVTEIGRFTAEKWGMRQRNKYLRQLDDAFQFPSRQPEIGKTADAIKPGHRKYNQGSHTIFYREGTESRRVVIRILHTSMDVERHPP